MIHSNEIPFIIARPRDTIDSYLIDTDFSCDIRNMLCADDDDNDADILADCESTRTLDLERCLLAIRNLDTESRTTMMLEYSLCPLHRCDYASCFDDDDPECAAIRIIHPDHDT